MLLWRGTRLEELRSDGARIEDGRLMHFFYMIICVYLFVPRWRPVIGRFLVLWHSFNKFVLAKRLHEPAVFNRNHIFFQPATGSSASSPPSSRVSSLGVLQDGSDRIGSVPFHICRRVFLYFWIFELGPRSHSCSAFLILALGVKCRPASIV